MSTTTQPDFEKLALDYTNDNGKHHYCSDGNHDHDCGCGHYEEGAKKIWTDYTLPAIQQLEAEKKKSEELMQALKDILFAVDHSRFEYKAGSLSIHERKAKDLITKYTKPCIPESEK